MASTSPPSNFTHLRAHDEQLLRLGQLAERYFPEDPNTCLLKLRQLAELLAQLVASNVGLFTSPDEKHLSIKKEWEDLCAKYRMRRVRVWTLDDDLAGLDRAVIARRRVA